MLILAQAFRWIFKLPKFRKAKPFTLHCSLLFLVLAYAFAGGFIFNRLESEAYKEHQKNDKKNKTECVSQILLDVTGLTSAESSFRNATADRIYTCFQPERDERSEWSFVTATLYGFGIVTTLGYNRIAPITYTGRLFCIVYGICGIPITMIIIANVGQYLNNFAGDSRRKLEAYRTQRRMSRASISGKEYKESSIQVTSLALLVVFLVYVAMGALLLPALNGQIDFFNGLYYNFLCLTAIDFGQLVPTRVAFLPITFLYVVLGLAITTIAIDIGSEYMKKLHYLGKKMKDAASTKIWFGGKTLKVRDLLHAVGKKCGVEPGMIDALDLENVVERTIAIQEGREPPDDLNDDPPQEPSLSERSPSPDRCSSPPSTESANEGSPFISARVATFPSYPAPYPNLYTRPIFASPRPYAPLPPPPPPAPQKPPSPKPCTDLVIRNPIFQSLSNEFPVYNKPAEEVIIKRPELLSATDFILPVRVEEDYTQHLIVVEPPAPREDVSLKRASSSFTLQLEKPRLSQPLLIEPTHTRPRSISPDPEERVPKKFKEKKEMYGRDPRKLFETYQEEWDRLDRLSDRNRQSPRRKSVLNFSSCGMDSNGTSTSSSPTRTNNNSFFTRQNNDVEAAQYRPVSRLERLPDT